MALEPSRFHSLEFAGVVGRCGFKVARRTDGVAYHHLPELRGNRSEEQLDSTSLIRYSCNTVVYSLDKIVTDVEFVYVLERLLTTSLNNENSDLIVQHLQIIYFSNYESNINVQ